MKRKDKEKIIEAFEGFPKKRILEIIKEKAEEDEGFFGVKEAIEQNPIEAKVWLKYLEDKKVKSESELLSTIERLGVGSWGSQLTIKSLRHKIRLRNLK